VYASDGYTQRHGHAELGGAGTFDGKLYCGTGTFDGKLYSALSRRIGNQILKGEGCYLYSLDKFTK
jgi:hypothetical protein